MSSIVLTTSISPSHKMSPEHALDVLDSNVGSITHPLRNADECTCCSDYIPADTIQPWTWERGHMEMPSRENTETINA